MGHVKDGKNVLEGVPQPGRPIAAEPQIIKETVVIEKETSVDVNTIAKAVVEALGDKLSRINIQTMHQSQESGGFDSSGTMEQLAKSMTVQKGNSTSNFENLGNIAETKKDKAETDQTIDLLSGIQD